MNQGKNQGLLAELKLLLRSVPSLTVTVFIVATISMNLLANKSINLPFSWLALDCGIIVSWIDHRPRDNRHGEPSGRNPHH